MRRVAAAVVLISLAHYLIAGGVAVVQAIQDVCRDQDVSFPEGVTIYLARQAQAGRAVFRDFTDPPHVPALYGPLAYYSIGWLGRLGAVDGLGLYAIGRCLSLAAAAISLFVLGRSVHGSGPSEPLEFTRGWRCAVTAVVLGACLACMHRLNIMATARPDMPAAALAFTGVVLAERRRLGWAIMCFVLAALFKQSFIAAPLSVLLWLLASGSRPAALRFAAGYAAVSAVIWGLCAFAWGKALPQHMIFANILPMDWLQAPRVLWNDRQSFALPAGMGLVLIAKLFAPRPIDLARLFAALSGAIGFITISKVGGAHNHLLEFAIACCWCLGRWCNERPPWLFPQSAGSTAASAPCPTPDARGAREPLVLETWLFLALLLVTVSINVPSHWHRMRAMPALAKRIDREPIDERGGAISDAFFTSQVVQFAARNRGLLLCSDPRVVVLSGQEPVAMDWILWAALIESGQLNDSAVRERIADGAFEIAIVDFDPYQSHTGPAGVSLWPEHVVAAILKHYRLQTMMGKYRVFVPARAAPKRAPSGPA